MITTRVRELLRAFLFFLASRLRKQLLPMPQLSSARRLLLPPLLLPPQPLLCSKGLVCFRSDAEAKESLSWRSASTTRRWECLMTSHRERLLCCKLSSEE